MDEQNIEQTETTTEIAEEQQKRNFKDLDKDSQRFYNLLHALFNICNLAGFRIEGRVKIRDMKTGKVWE